ncbi:MAG TPA: ABC transporter permease [Humisphaera sp.]|nr:ABC transporter permease [Humisphaera sp.]
MRFFRTFRTALTALSRNVMRAILTTLGIIIGIAAVIAMMEIGNGSSASIAKTIANMGANSLIVFPGSSSSGGVSFGAGTGMTLTPQDCDAVLRECPDVYDAAPIVRVRTQVVYRHRNWVPNWIYGTTPSYLNVRDWNDMAEGASFTEADVRNASKVCMIGQTLVRELFDKESPLGQEVRVQNVTFKVVGVLGTKGASMMGQDQDDILLAPWTTIKFRVSGNSSQVNNQSAAGAANPNAVNTLSSLYPSASLSLFDTPSPAQLADTPLPVRFINVDQILISATSPETTSTAMREVNTLLRQRHHLRNEDDDDFQTRDMAEMVKAFTSASGIMTSLLLAVACISLIVGGVGIMNIMLVSVTERTKEIGLRMAVGATAQDILSQFLTEAVLLCMAGGIAGILLGVGSSWLITATLGWPTVSSPIAIVVAFIVAAGVGIVFGFYPAWKASSLDPIDALRYE